MNTDYLKKLLLLIAVIPILFSACQKGHIVIIETDYGTMKAELYDSTPLHRDNFLQLAKEGYYDSLLFHRVISNFMIQGGDPDSKNAKQGQRLGMGGPGYTIPAEFIDTLYHVKGALAAARTPNPEKASSGSQFYIVQGRPISEADIERFEVSTGKPFSTHRKKAYLEKGGYPMLDGEYTVFGQVVEGLDVIDKITAQQVDGSARPTQDIRMKVRVK